MIFNRDFVEFRIDDVDRWNFNRIQLGLIGSPINKTGDME